ncbi:YjbF family lipoprotein [Ruegeria marina]|nr:YjbF family lipoprotein [Ruegeria marina]
MKRLASFGLLLLLAACSSGTEEAPLQVQVLNNTAGLIRQRLGPPDAGLPPVTRAQLDALEGAALEVTVEARDAAAYLYVNAERDDGAAGQVTVWRTGDNSTIALRNGVLVATRGLGGDVLSSEVRVGGGPGPSGGGAHVMLIRGGDEEAQRMALVCELADLGTETIEIVERRYPTRHLQQTCSGSGGEAINDYWVDERAGLVRQSRQWAGPYLGYLRLRQLAP